MKSFQPYPHAYINGTFVPIEAANISVMTNGFQYGTGVFGGVKGFLTDANEVAIFRLEAHIDRLATSCETLHFEYQVDKEQLKKVFIDLTQKNKPNATVYYRPLIYRSDTRLSPGMKGEFDFALYMLDMPGYLDNTNGTRVCISSWQRNPDTAIPPRTKAMGGYINSALAINEAAERGYDSAIMLDKNGDVSEGAVMNIFIVKDGVLITPSLDSDILEGITRRTVIQFAKELAIPIEERKVSKDELYEADEMFFTGTAVSITWCRQVDTATISEQAGPITQKITEVFDNLLMTHPELYTPIAI